MFDYDDEVRLVLCLILISFYERSYYSDDDSEYGSEYDSYTESELEPDEMSGLSSEYTVTKVDSRTGRKPMRTYGKRPATESSMEPLAKKQRVNGRRVNDTNGDESDASSSTIYPSSSISNVINVNSSQADQEKIPKANPANTKKRGILSYYKPVPATTPSAASETASVRSSMPPSPCRDVAQATKRPRRMLRVRPTIPSSPAGPSNRIEEVADVPTEDKENTTKDEQQEEMGPATKPSTSKPSATVQTTLNISARASYSECKICDTVWNPFYEYDMKYHRKRHAAVLRANAKKQKAAELV